MSNFPTTLFVVTSFRPSLFPSAEIAIAGPRRVTDGQSGILGLWAARNQQKPLSGPIWGIQGVARVLLAQSLQLLVLPLPPGANSYLQPLEAHLIRASL
jgi:hypothetical protein